MNISISVKTNTKPWEKMRKILLEGKHKAEDVGWMDGKVHPNEPDVLVAQIASWLEQGTINQNGNEIPPRPYIRQGFIPYLKSSGVLKQWGVQYLPLIMTGKMTWESFYEKIGPELVKILQKIMYDWQNPPNAPLTIELKGFNDPLKETGFLIESIQSRIGRK